MATTSGTRSPCGACKFLRRKCAADCIFAPYFCCDQGPALFAAIHKVFGASNVSKLLQHVPVADRYEAVVTIAYEAQARIRDPVYGCVAHILALQQQVAYLQAQLMQAKAQVAQNLSNSSCINNIDQNQDQWQANLSYGEASLSVQNHPQSYISHPISPQSSLESIDYSNYPGVSSREEFSFEPNCSKKRPCSGIDSCELLELAFRMMRN